MRLSRLGWRINNGKCVRSVRRPGLFKSEPVGTRGLWCYFVIFAAKCYFVQNGNKIEKRGI